MIELLWPTDYVQVNQPFGANQHIYRHWGLPGHEGIDIAAPHGSNIYACASGSVYSIFFSKAYGINVRIDHENGYKTIYAHLQRALVSIGDRVVAGEVIGLADSTGNSSGSHLHLTLKKEGATANKETIFPNDIVDPTPFLKMPAGLKERSLRVVARAGLNMRKGPGSLYPVIKKLKYGTWVQITDSVDLVKHLMSDPNQWLKISHGGEFGWCSIRYLEWA